MKTYISILRGINVGGKRKILMEDLKKLYGNLGFKDVNSYIQSGNVIFNGEETTSEIEISAKIEESILVNYNFEVPVIVRELEEWKKITASNPFLKEGNENLHLTFLKALPDNEKVKILNEKSFLPDRFKIKGQEVYISCSGKYSDCKLSNQFIEKGLGVRSTTRNWKTVEKLLKLSKENQ